MVKGLNEEKSDLEFETQSGDQIRKGGWHWWVKFLASSLKSCVGEKVLITYSGWASSIMGGSKRDCQIGLESEGMRYNCLWNGSTVTNGQR